MPIYEYRCDGCGHELDALQKMNDSPLTDCPACDKAKLRKLVSAPSFRLKGNGWYETDFKDSGKKKDNSTAASESSGDKNSKSESDSKKSADASGSQKPQASTSASTASD